MHAIGSRLALLRRQSGKTPTRTGGSGIDADAADDPQGELRDRLQQVTRSRRQYCRPQRITDAELAVRLGGRCVAEGLILVERNQPFGSSVGKELLTKNDDDIAFFSQDSPVVFMDTETTGLSGGTGTLAFLLALGLFDTSGLQVRQYFLTGFKGESALLDSAGEMLEPANTLVTFNGKGFDHPLLATRYRLAGLTDPFASLNHLDLLHPTRSAFASRWPDCRLQSAERRLLGFNRSGDLPGSEVPDAWFSWVRHGDVGRLPSLLEHNYQDVVSLAILLHRLHTCFTQPRKYGADILAIARNRQRLCDSETAQELLKENRSYLDQKGLLELARLSRRQGKTELAREIWGELTRQSNLEAMEYLAKDYEHTLRDPFEALRITRLMLEITGDDPAHRHRERRLLAKIRSSKDVKPLPKC